MEALAHVWALGGIDLKNVRRDPMLIWLAVSPIVIALAARWGIPALSTELSIRYDFDLFPHYPLILSFLAFTMPMLVGAIIGFLLLDQRDDGTLTALQVTPLTLRRFMLYRSFIPMGLSLVMTVVALMVCGLMVAGPVELMLYALVASLFGPVFALFTASFAANKVQGFALMKASGVVAWPAIIAWFVAMPSQLWFGLVPHYWMAKVIWLGEAGENAWGYAAVAVVFEVVLLVLLLRRFERVVSR